MEIGRCDVAVVGGGIVGLATVRELLRRFRNLRLILLEKEERLASHQTGRNSGVIHSGIYYPAGSLKTKLCLRGAQVLKEFCKAHGIPYERFGKVIVAVDQAELERLRLLYENGIKNGIPHLRWIRAEELREREPYGHGLAAIFLPEAAVVDFVRVAEALAREVRDSSGTIHTSTCLRRVEERQTHWRLETNRGFFEARFLVNCGGLFVDRIGREAGDHAPIRILPFRGEYYELKESRAFLVKGLVYPVPDPRFPFLGIHFTRTLSGRVLVGPNAVLALKREGYQKGNFSLKDCLEILLYSGFWKMAARYWKTGIEEAHRSLSKEAFLHAAKRLLPELLGEDLVASFAGVRAQAVDSGGNLLNDFFLKQSQRALHVYNAPSPAATASLGIAEAIVDRLKEPLSAL